MRRVSVGGAWLALLVLSGCGNRKGTEGPQQGPQGASRALPVEVLALEPGQVQDTGEYLGQLISRRSVTLRPQVSGYVQAIHVRPGEQVKAGQVLLVVDPRRERAGLRAAEAQRASAVANREYARNTRQRAEQLLAEGLLSRQDYEQAVAQASSAEASARAAEAEIQSQQVQLGYHQVSAPFAGVVGDIPVKVGDSVTPETELTRVDQSQALELSVQVPVERAARIEPGHTPVEVLDGEDKLLVSAPVFFVAPTPVEATQLVEVKAAFENTMGLRAGQLVRARVVYATRQALLLPTYAVSRLGSQSFAFTVVPGDGGTVVQRQPVTLGQVQGNSFELLEGLEAGTQVAVSGVQLLQDGQAVVPKPAEPKGAQGTGVGGASDAGQ
ncbi:efflux RND transporter periplasmic adaptor subunit [Hyalangium rubrum]|uniref:Efflux RND transporter periplasmic adaptor subunit n=1 Tax=Hyalangium rubrum TaxID=3103134 RepID=A0ABU5GVS7_9BACT|nr:efflux RND transporter periplasmic adaptor subunit [Hyalangium sp. s54d21]MDY7225293.1 efflux RND transporter periplasmic adaptor subunit [Hyalangium sp. s54d21]